MLITLMGTMIVMIPMIYHRNDNNELTGDNYDGYDHDDDNHHQHDYGHDDLDDHDDE